MSLRWLLLFAGCAVFANAQSCGKKCLRGVLDSYRLGMTRHDPSKLNLAPAVKFTENGQAMQLGEGFWKTAGSVTYKLYALDAQGGAAAVEAVVRENGQPVIFLLRVKVAGKAIGEAETIVCRKDQAGVFAPEKLTVAPPMFLQLVPLAERVSRKDLIAAADAYYKSASLAADASRFENGEQTAIVPAPSAAVVKRRFPVVDVEHGLVLGIGLISTPGPGGVLLAEMFKVTGGMIQQVQAVMVNHPKTGPTGWN